MPYKKSDTPEKYFNRIVKDLFYDLIQRNANLQKGKEKDSDENEKELQEKLHHILKQECAFRFRAKLKPEELLPLASPSDPKFMFPRKSNASYEEFFSMVHLAYLEPYLRYAGFAYGLAGTLQASPERIFDSVYEIPIPIKLPGKKYYNWYGQRIYVLKVNNFRAVVDQANIYIFQNRSLLLSREIEKSKGEYRYIEATVLKDGDIDEEITEILRGTWKSHLLTGLQTVPTALRILKIKIMNPTLQNAEVAEMLSKNQHSWNATMVAEENKKLITFFADNTGYHFADVEHLVSYCDFIGLSNDIQK